MGRQRNIPQMKGKEEVSETMLTEKEASQLWDSEFKEMVMRKLNELTHKYKELSENYISIEKRNRNYKQNPGRNEQ